MLLTAVILGTPCDEDGFDLPAGTPPPPRQPKPKGDWSPFESRVQFDLAERLYTKDESSAPTIDDILQIWAADKLESGGNAPFANHKEMYGTIDGISHGDVPWQSFMVAYDGERPATNPPEWMKTKFVVWHRDLKQVVHQLLANPDFEGEINYSPYREFCDGKRRWGDFMSGNWSWKEAVSI